MSLSQIVMKALVGTMPLAVLAFTPSAAQAVSFSNLYVFGDSLSETGNVYRATGNLFPPSPPYFNGRFADGPIWVELLAPKLGLSFDPTKDFAFVSATTGSTNTAPIPGLPGLQQEFQLFRATNPITDPDALYTILAGNNDYLGGGQTNPAVPVQNLVSFVNSLADSGAKNILISNLPDLGKIPAINPNASSPGNTDPAVAAGLTALTTGHNTRLSLAIDTLRQQRPNLNLISLDIASLINDVVTNPNQFGFNNVTDACLPFSPGVDLAPSGFPCSTPDTYLFWDRFHITSAAHEYLAETAYQTIDAAAVPEPSATAGLVLAGGLLMGMVYSKRKRQFKVLASVFIQTDSV